MGALILAVPPARQVKCRDNTKPNYINAKQVKTKRGRDKGNTLRIGNILPCISHSKEQNNVVYPDQIELQHIVKERHSTINNEYACEPVIYSLKRAQQQQARTNGHTQV